MYKFITNYLKNISLLTLFIIVFICVYFSSYNPFDNWFIITMIIVFSIIWIYITIKAYKQAKQYDVELHKEPLIIKEMYNPILLQHNYVIPISKQLNKNNLDIEIMQNQSEQMLLKNVNDFIINESYTKLDGTIQVTNKIYIYKKD